VPESSASPSARQVELLEAAYRYTLTHGLTQLSLRPLATAIGSSPRVLLYLFGSKDGLVRALLARARVEELELLADLDAEPPRGPGSDDDRLGRVATRLWTWLVAAEHRALLTLWLEGYARSLVEPDGPWSGFARATVEDWLDVLAAAQPGHVRDTDDGRAQRTRVLALLRGALADLLATGDVDRTGAAVRRGLGDLA
jgi:AcrR family transcriptional regulator